MGVNRFETPIAAQFINTYVPIPFDQMLKAGQMKQDRYEKASAATDALVNRIEMINAIPNSPDDLYKKQAIDKMYEIRDKYVTKDLSDPFIQRDLSNDIRRNIDSDWIRKAESSYASWQQAQSGKRELAMNNKLNPLLDDDPATSWNSKEMGEYNYNPRAFVGTAELFDPYFSQISPNDVDIVNVDGVDVMRQFVADYQIKDVTDKAAQELESTPAGKDHIRLYRMAHPNTKLSNVEILKEVGTEFGNQWRKSQYQILPGNVQRKSGDEEGFSYDPENIGRYGTKEGKPANMRDVEKYVSDITSMANNGDQDAENKLEELQTVWDGVMNTPKKGSLTTPKEQIDKITAKGNMLFETALESLIDTGMDENQAFNYLVSNQTNNDLIPMYSPYGQQSGGVQINADRIRGQFQGGMDIIKSDIKAKYLPGEEGKKYEEYLNSKIRSDKPEKILAAYMADSKSLENEYSNKQKEIEKYKLEEFNELQSYQETYTKVSGMFGFNESKGVFEGTYEDENGSSKKYSSWLSKEISDVIYNRENYQNEFYNENGKPIKRSRNIDKLIRGANGFTITNIDNKPVKTKQGDAVRVTVNVLNENGMPTGEKFKVDLPIDTKRSMGDYVRELTKRGQTETAFTSIHYNTIEDAIKEADVFKGGSIKLVDLGAEGEDPNNRIEFDVNSAGIMPILIKDGERYNMANSRVRYNNLTPIITNYLYTIS